MTTVKQGSWTIIRVKDESTKAILSLLEKELVRDAVSDWVLDFTGFESMEKELFAGLKRLSVLAGSDFERLQILNPSERILSALAEAGLKDKCRIRHLFPTAW